MRKFALILLIAVSMPRVLLADDVSSVRLLVGRSTIVDLPPKSCERWKHISSTPCSRSGGFSLSRTIPPSTAWLSHARTRP